MLEAAAGDIPTWLQDSLSDYAKAAVTDYVDADELGYCWAYVARCTKLHKSLFLLILAEALADSGL